MVISLSLPPSPTPGLYLNQRKCYCISAVYFSSVITLQASLFLWYCSLYLQYLIDHFECIWTCHVPRALNGYISGCVCIFSKSFKSILTLMNLMGITIGKEIHLFLYREDRKLIKPFQRCSAISSKKAINVHRSEISKQKVLWNRGRHP